MISVDVRVSSTIKLSRCSIINYPTYQSLFYNLWIAKATKEIFN
jgi:hypothetical protein